MRRLRTRVRATFAALSVLGVLSCGKSVTGPIPGSAEDRLFEWSFEEGGRPTLEGWRVTNPALTSLVPDPAPGGGKWGLGLEADWAPTTGFVTLPIAGIRDGDVLRLSAFVRAVGEDGGGMIGLAVGVSGQGYQGTGYRWTDSRWACAVSASWTRVSVQDTVSLPPGDTLWVVLSSPHTEITRRQGHFDRVELTRIQTRDRVPMD